MIGGSELLNILIALIAVITSLTSIKLITGEIIKIKPIEIDLSKIFQKKKSKDENDAILDLQRKIKVLEKRVKDLERQEK